MEALVEKIEKEGNRPDQARVANRIPIRFLKIYCGRILLEYAEMPPISARLSHVKTHYSLLSIMQDPRDG